MKFKAHQINQDLNYNRFLNSSKDMIKYDNEL